MTIKRTRTGYVIVCGPAMIHKALPGCWECGRPAPFLCDREVGLPVGLDPSEPNLCSRPLCVHHRTNRGVEIDYCKDHVTS